MEIGRRFSQSGVHVNQPDQNANFEERLREVELNLRKAKNDIDDINALEKPPIIQIMRNTDFTYSVNGYFNTVNAPGDQEEELAYFYGHPKDAQVTVRDAVMASGSTDFNSATGGFEPGDVGKVIIVDGAGAGGNPLVTTIGVYSDTNNIKTVDPAVTDVTGARARFRCVKLLRKNEKTDPGTAPSEVLKCTDHSQYGLAGNLTSPDWNKEQGEVRFGNTNALTVFHGFADSSGQFFPQVQPFRQGNEVWVLFKMALKTKFIKPKGYLYAGLWDNSDSALEFLRSSDLVLTANVVNINADVFPTVTAKYLVVAYASNGRTYKSNILEVPNCPDGDYFNPPNVQVNLSWTYIPNIVRLEFYRQLGGGNVFLLETVNSGIAQYYDVNYGGRTDTGTVNFPAVAAQDLDVPCLAQTNDFRNLVVNGEGNWQEMYLKIPVTPTTNFSSITELALIIGLTEEVAFEVKACSVNAGFPEVEAPEACFEAGMVGKAVVLTDSVESNINFTGTVAAVISPTIIQLTAAIPFSSTSLACEIAFNDEHGIFMDVLGVSFNKGKWAKHPDDDGRLLPQSSLPPTTTQGGGTSGGGGGIGCVLENRLVQRYDPATGKGTPDFARNFKAGDLCYFGRPGVPNRIKEVVPHTVYQYWEVDIAGIWSTQVTASHRFVRDKYDTRNGTPLEEIKNGAFILPSIENTDILETINKRFVACPDGVKVVSFIMEEDSDRPDECRLLIVDNILFHNSKLPDIFIIE